MKIPIVSIIGRPNVGKSTFFNRIAGARIAITADEAGTTRDRIFFKVNTPDIDYFLVDTGGLEFEKKANLDLEDNVQKQANIAIEESDVIIFMVNAKENLLADDFKVASLLRKNLKGKTVLLLANKCDSPIEDTDLANMFELGLGKPIPISATHNSGIDYLKKEILKTLKDRHFLFKSSKEYKAAKKEDSTYLNIALLGKTNVGKSSLINAISNSDKLIVSDVAGTTRDSTDTIINYNAVRYNFIDTAGLRKRGKIERGVEHFSVIRTLSSIERCDVALLVLDSSQEISHQDQQIANTILKSYKPIIILINKWDIKGESKSSEENRRTAFISYLQNKFPFLHWAPIIFTSAVKKTNLSKIFENVDLVVKEASKRISTAKLNSFVDGLIEKHKPSGTKSISPKLFYITQDTIKPPHFILFVNKKKYFHFSYLRYLENRLREKFSFFGTPIVMDFKEKERRFSKKN